MTDTLLIVEDDMGLQKQLKWCFDGYNIAWASDRQQAIAAMRRVSPAVVTLDLGLPPDPSNASEGMATLQALLALAPATKIIVVTGNDDRQHAIEAVALGAYDFYQKPIDPTVLGLIVARAFQLSHLERAHQQLLQQPSATHGIIASSAAMQAVMRMIDKVAPTQATTLLLGESGTGKEVLAKAIHQRSSRAERPFVAVNCAAIPENLLESELFGYEKGAFTGAVSQSKGKIEYAQGGTFFLDEIGDLPLSLQAKLLRFLQERVIERVGGRKEIAVDIRVICATHQPLPELIAQGRFREDLYYRLSEIVIDIPPLRQRPGDGLSIAQALLQRYCHEHHRKAKRLSSAAAAAIESHAWPGNIREMENRLKRAVILSDSAVIDVDALGLQQPSAPAPFNLREVREAAESAAIRRALQLSDDNVSEAARLLGVTRPTLYSLFEKYRIQGRGLAMDKV
jgi:two-component system NtrC family response regulator